MQKLITRICWTRRGVSQFTDEINSHLEEGWNLSGFSIEKKGFRFICYALLVDLPLEPEVEAN
jgi:hypothetical protein